MNCTVCKEEISAARLAAIPDASKCIGCATRYDVPLKRRYDEQTPDGEVISTEFTHNPYIAAHIERFMTGTISIPDNACETFTDATSIDSVGGMDEYEESEVEE